MWGCKKQTTNAECKRLRKRIKGGCLTNKLWERRWEKIGKVFLTQPEVHGDGWKLVSLVSNHSHY